MSTFAFNDFGTPETCFSLSFNHTRPPKRTRYTYKKSEIIWLKEMILSAALAKSGPLDFQPEKSFLLFFPRKRVSDTCFKNSLVVLQFSFLRRHKPKMIFDQTNPVNSDRKCKFQRFCPARSDSNNVAHGILPCYKL